MLVLTSEIASNLKKCIHSQKFVVSVNAGLTGLTEVFTNEREVCFLPW